MKIEKKTKDQTQSKDQSPRSQQLEMRKMRKNETKKEKLEDREYRSNNKCGMCARRGKAPLKAVILSFKC